MDELYEEYIERLINCGYSPCSAYFTYHTFVREIGVHELDEFLECLEDERCGSNLIQTLQPEM